MQPCDHGGVGVTGAEVPDGDAAAPAGQPLRGIRSLRRRLVGESPAHVGGIAELGYGMGPPPGPFDRPPSEPVELDDDELPWELRER